MLFEIWSLLQSLRLGTSQSGATLERRMPRERPPTHSAHTEIMGARFGTDSQVIEVLAQSWRNMLVEPLRKRKM